MLRTTLAALALLASPITAQSYNAFDLDGNGLLGVSAAFRLSETGTACGLGDPIGLAYTHAVTWSGLQTTILPTLPGDESAFANDISDAGDVVGGSDNVEQTFPFIRVTRRGVLWTGGNPVALASLVTGGATNLELGEGRRINERGQILGEARDPAISRLRAFILENGIVTDVGALRSGGGTEPFDMNDLGHVVGRSEVEFGFDHAFVWRNGSMTDLHDPSIILGQNSTARAINAAGVIVGSADFVPGGIQKETAARWVDGVPENLGVLAGSQGYARDINDHGTIVGTSTVTGGGVHAFIYRNGRMEDLNQLIPSGSGWTLSNAHDIANDGRIVGEGFLNGVLRPYMLVPECDGSFSIYGAGCAGSGGYVPALWGQGCPEPGGQISLAVTGGLGGSFGLLTFGTGMLPGPVNANCSLQNLLLVPGALVPFPLGGALDGEGTWQVSFRVPRNATAQSLFLQAVLLDAGPLTVTNPLQMDIR